MLYLFFNPFAINKILGRLVKCSIKLIKLKRGKTFQNKYSENYFQKTIQNYMASEKSGEDEFSPRMRFVSSAFSRQIAET